MPRRRVETSWRGLHLVGTYSRESASRECPASESGGLTHIRVADDVPEAFVDAPAEISECICGGSILPTPAEFWLLRKYADEIDRALCQAGRESEDAGDEGEET